MASSFSQAGAGSTCSQTNEFNFSVRLGLVFIVQAAVSSGIAVATLLAYIGYSTVQITRNAPKRWSSATHVHYYFISLLISELIQAVGGVMSVRWIVDAEVTEGPTCTAQGVLKQAGDVGVALASLAIAVHTFTVLVLRWRPTSSPKIAILVLTMIWLFLALIIGISFATHKGEDYYGNTQYWCWITSGYFGQRIGLEYLWLWMTAFINIILYVPIALVIRGVIDVEGWSVRVVPKCDRVDLRNATGAKKAADVAMKMLFYPAVYTITVIPIAITRWHAFLGHCVPWPATVFADIVFALSGLFNCMLYTITRPTLVPRHERTNSGRTASGSGGTGSQSQDVFLSIAPAESPIPMNDIESRSSRRGSVSPAEKNPINIETWGEHNP